MGSLPLSGPVLKRTLNFYRLESPLDLFVYRFHNNDPINDNAKMDYMTDTRSWAKLFGLDMDKILYQDRTSLRSINRYVNILAVSYFAYGLVHHMKVKALSQHFRSFIW